MSTQQGATREFRVDKRFTALELIGGYDCFPDYPQRRPDLTVDGGVRIRKTACLEGNLTLIRGDGTIEGNLTVLGNTFLTTVYAEKIFSDDLCVNDLEVDGNAVINNIVGNTATITDISSVCLTTDKIRGNTATFVDTTTTNLTAVCVEADKIIGNTATFVDTTTGNLTATCADTDKLVASNADVQCLTVPQIKGVQKMGGAGDLVICNDGDLILEPTGDVILSNLAMDFDLTKSVLSNVRAVQAPAVCPLDLSTDPGFKVTISGGDGLDLVGRDLCNAGNIQAVTINVDDLSVDHITANSVSVIEGNICVQGEGAVQTDIIESKTGGAVPVVFQSSVSVNGTVLATTFGGSLVQAFNVEIDNALTVQGKVTADNLCANTLQVANGNVDTLYVSNIFGLSPVTVDDECRFLSDVNIAGGNLTAALDVCVDGGLRVKGDLDANIAHSDLLDLLADDHTQYAHLGGRSGGQLFFGGTSAGETLILTPNTFNAPIGDTGNVIVGATLDSTSSTTGGLIVSGGVGIEKTLNVGRAIAGGYVSLPTIDGSVSLPDNKHVVILTSGATGAFDIILPTQTLPGQVLHVYNNSGFASTGNVITADGTGATLVSDGTAWYQL